jgi:hypothetical protein
MDGNASWMAAAITMDGGGKIEMDGSSGNGQRWHNGRQDGRVIAMDNGGAVAQWTAQWVADNHHQHRSGAMGGDAKWMEAAVTMDGGGVIAMDGGSGDGQRQRNG